MNLFYVEQDAIEGQTLIVSGQEANHIRNVLRRSVGDNVQVTDGKGRRFECTIRDFVKDRVFLDILNVKEEAMGRPSVTLCIGIIKKKDRMEFAVEKAVELGVSKIVFFRGDYSEKQNVRQDRLNRTAISAMKQSLRLYRPEIFVEDSLQKTLSIHSKEAVVIVADEKLDKQKGEFKKASTYCLVVGPEGGFSENEREYLATIEPGYYSLGEKRLRTETAAIIMADRFINRE